MASSSNVPKGTLFTEAGKIHRKLVKALKTKPEIKVEVHMMLLCSIPDNLDKLNEAARTTNIDDYNLTQNTIYDPVYHYGGGTIEDVTLKKKHFETVVLLLNEREELVEVYLKHHVANSKQRHERDELMSELNTQLNMEFPSGIFVPAPSSS
jgi:hypothetical protein